MEAVSRNTVQLLGHIGQEIDFRSYQDGKHLARVSLATSEIVKRPDGDEKITTWHNLEAWGDLALKLNEQAKKGDKVYVEGKLTYRTYETKTGEKRYTTLISVTDFNVLPK